MFESIPGLLLVVMITITLIVLPYLNDDRPGKARPVTEEIRINVKRDRE